MEKIEQATPVEGGEPSKGIPWFWYTVLKNVTHTADKIKVWYIFEEFIRNTGLHISTLIFIRSSSLLCSIVGN